MVCHARSASLSARRRRQHLIEVSSLALLDLSKPTEREAHDFLRRATSKPDQLWRLLDMRRHEATLLCVVRWIHPGDAAKPFSLAEVSLTKTAMFWQYYKTAQAARAEMERRCT